MGFPVGYTEVFILPKFFVYALSFLGFIRNLIVSLFNYLGLSDFLETDTVWPDNPTHTTPEKPPVSALLIREILQVIKYEELIVAKGDPPESCAVCLYEFQKGEEIRWLRNCRHVFHRACLDRWMDHDQKTCPLCRTTFVPDELQEEFNQRLWAASGIVDFYRNWTGKAFVNVPQMTIPYISKFYFSELTCRRCRSDTWKDNMIAMSNRFQVDVNGQLKLFAWSTETENWNMYWTNFDKFRM